MAALIAGSSTGPGPPIKQKKPPTMSRALRNKAQLILKSKKNANLLCDILEMFNKESKNYTPVLLALEMVFATLLRRGDMFENVVAMKPKTNTPEEIHARWLRSNYDTAMGHLVGCMTRGEESSRVQALVTCCKLLIEEGKHPIHPNQGDIWFPVQRLRNIFMALLNSEISQSALINRYQEYTEYRDFQQNGLKVLTAMGYHKCPSQMYIQNYLELFDAVVKPGLPTRGIQHQFERHPDDKYACERDGIIPTRIFNPTVCKGFVNRCWGYCLNWPLRATEGNHKRALIVLVDRIMPYLSKPVVVTDLLCDSLDCGPSISMIALRGMMELVTKHKIDYPDIYDRLYAMFEPEMFATRSKKRLLHLADVFLSSTRLPETLVAAFAKRLSRLALVAPPEDTGALLQLISNMIQRHPGLRKMLRQGQPPIMPKDPYVMEEASANASRAIHSSLWEVAALQQHFTPEISATAVRILASAEGARPPDLPPSMPDQEQFDMEVRKRFKVIEMNFVRVSPTYYLSTSERISKIFNMASDFY